MLNHDFSICEFSYLLNAWETKAIYSDECMPIALPGQQCPYTEYTRKKR